jgi:phage terminase large subunit-like protein
LSMSLAMPSSRSASPPGQPSSGSRSSALRDLESLLAERTRRRNRNKLVQLYPDDGPLRRELYPKHLKFFAAGGVHQERCMMAANRVGKTWGVGGYETSLHLTGEYPDWWPGIRFKQPIQAWTAGDTSETTRDVVQASLMGPLGELGTGLIPADLIIGEPTKRAGVAGAMDTGRVRHISGGTSLVGFKSYDQGRKKFQGTAKHLIWLDEEPPEDVYDECLIRLMTTNGIMLCTFTPLEGLTNIALRYRPELSTAKEAA